MGNEATSETKESSPSHLPPHRRRAQEQGLGTVPPPLNLTPTFTRYVTVLLKNTQQNLQKSYWLLKVIWRFRDS